MKKKVVIIGAGTIGLHCAYFLSKTGHEVEVIEAASETDTSGCSYGNCGLIVPSHFIPLASPAMLKSAFKMMFDRKSPVSVPIRKNISHVQWFLKFIKTASTEHIKKSATVLFNLNTESKKLYREIYNQSSEEYNWKDNGLLMACTTPGGWKEEIELAGMAGELGIETRILQRKELNEVQPGLNFNGIGAVWYLCDAHLHPLRYLNYLKVTLTKLGVKILYNTPVKELQVKKSRIIGAETDAISYKADEFVLAAGIYSRELARKLGISIPMISGKGYSIDFYNSPVHLNIPIILTEARIALTPFSDSLRLGSGMELNGKIGQVNLQRVQAMLDRTQNALPDFPRVQAHKLKIWEGLRPVTPDGIPLIGRIKKLENLLIATGHAMMGVSLAPVTGKIICDLVGGKADGLFENYRLDRF